MKKIKSSLAILLAGMTLLSTSCKRDPDDATVHMDALRAHIEMSANMETLFEKVEWQIDSTYTLEGNSGDTTYQLQGERTSDLTYRVKETMHYPVIEGSDTNYILEYDSYEGDYDPQGQWAHPNSLVLRGYERGEINTTTNDTIEYAQINYTTNNNNFKEMIFTADMKLDTVEFTNQKTKQHPQFWESALKNYSLNLELVGSQVVSPGFYKELQRARTQQKLFEELFEQYDLNDN